MLRSEVERTPRCALRAHRYVVAWNGVLALAYEGLPKPLVDLKMRLEEACEALPKENPGSQWPKTTVAALRDDVRLTPGQLEKLLDICERLDLQRERTEVDDLDLVVYACRSLERKTCHQNLKLSTAGSTHEQVDPCDRDKVQRVLEESKDPNYWFHASKDGNRSSHYRKPCPGVTLVHTLKNPPSTLDRFRSMVEQAMPGLYVWFDVESLHVTMRAVLC